MQELLALIQKYQKKDIVFINKFNYKIIITIKCIVIVFN